MGCCPFHTDKTPSFAVHPVKNFYKCFGCEKGGDVYSFLMDIEGLSFPEAIKRVAEESGTLLPLPLPEEIREAKESPERREVLTEAEKENYKKLFGEDYE